LPTTALMTVVCLRAVIWVSGRRVRHGSDHSRCLYRACDWTLKRFREYSEQT
jgi:hypothetical protein